MRKINVCIAVGNPAKVVKNLILKKKVETSIMNWRIKW